MERIAKTLKKDPLEIKLLNMQKIDSPLPNLITELQTNSEYTTRKAAVDTFNRVIILDSKYLLKLSFFFLNRRTVGRKREWQLLQ